MKNLLAIIVTGVVLVGCNNSDGDMYLGKWTNVQSPDISLEVTKHEGGNGYTVTRYNHQRAAESYAGIADGKTLVLSTIMGGGIPMEMKGNEMSVNIFQNCSGDCVLWNKAAN